MMGGHGGGKIPNACSTSDGFWGEGKREGRSVTARGGKRA